MSLDTIDIVSDETDVVELTPPGRGAVAVVLVAGPAAFSAVSKSFMPASGRPLTTFPPGRIALGRWGGPHGEELIVCRRTDNEIEIHCHGGLAAVNAVIERLLEHGCHRKSWQAWLRSSTADPIQADACIALAEASTARTAAMLLDQYHGALRDAVEHAVAAIASRNWQRAAEEIDAVLARGDVGVHLTTPWRVVLAGPANVGKSSLINALAGYQRAIVSHVAGTTRDVVTTQTAIDGWPVQLADTAGLRTASDELEAAGIALAESAVASADLLVLVHDATAHKVPTRMAAFEFEPNGAKQGSAMCVLQVLNKVDLIATTDKEERKPPQWLATSALTGQGIKELVVAIGRALVPAAPPEGAAVPFTAEQVAAFNSARVAIDKREGSRALAALQPLLASTSRA